MADNSGIPEGVSEEIADEFSSAREREVAQRFMGRIQWEMILIGLGQLIGWLSTWWLVLSGRIPLWAGFLLATLCACFAYLPSHEGQHGNLSGRNRRFRWIDFVVGQLSLITIAQSHEVLRVTHMKHHAYTNDPDRDVDAWATMGTHWWHPALGVHQGMKPEVIEGHAERDPAFLTGLQRGIPVDRAFALIQLVLVVFLPLEILFLWWLPAKIALSYLAVYFSWLPHYPLEETGRYKDTRFWRIRLPRYVDQSMQTHVIHHLFPGIPHWDEPKAMEALRPFLIARGVPGAEDIPEKVRFNPLMAD